MIVAPPHEETDAAPAEVTTHPAAPVVNPLAQRWVLVALAALIATGAGLAGWLVAARPPGDESAEAGFARDMRRHHQQAVEIAFIILAKTSDPLIAGLATDIIGTQQSQAGQMLGWLDAWGLPAAGEEPAMAWMGHPAEEPMPGMATPAEIAHLKELSGQAADAEFLRLMIRHHQGGTPMAEAILERTDRDEVRRLARSIVESQAAEIDFMEGLLEKMGTA